MNPFGTSERLPALLQAMRRFVDAECIPREQAAHEHDPEALDATLAELRPLARAAGLYTPQLPREWGGLALSWRDRAALLEEAGRSYLAPGAIHCAPPDQPNMINLLVCGTAAQQERYLRPLVEGSIRSCFAMTEPAPGAGSDPSMLRSTAESRGTGWVLNGHKWYISGAIGAAFAIVMARTGPGASLFIVELGHPGVEVLRNIGTHGGFGIGGHAELRFTNCELGAEALLGEAGRGFDYAQQRLEPARLSHCMRFIGRARRALDIAQAYVLQRDSFGQKLAEAQQIQAMVADSLIDLHASRLMTWHCAALLDAGLPIKTESAMTKVFVSEAVNRVADRAAQMMGAMGMSHDTRVAHILAELRPFRIYDGASELHRATLGRRALREAERRAEHSLSLSNAQGTLP